MTDENPEIFVTIIDDERFNSEMHQWRGILSHCRASCGCCVREAIELHLFKYMHTVTWLHGHQHLRFTSPFRAALYLASGFQNDN